MKFCFALDSDVEKKVGQREYTCCVRAAVAEQPDVVTEQRVVRAAPGDEWTLSTTDGRTPSRLLRDSRTGDA
jgi:hypothetical protein